MKIKVSKLKKIISEEIKKCLLEQASDKKKAAQEYADHLLAAADAKKKTGEHESAESEELQTKATEAQNDVDKMTETEGDLDEFWPTVARAAGAYSAGKIADKILDEDEDEQERELEETIKKIDGKWCLFSKDGKKNLGGCGSKKRAREREREVNYFKQRDK